MLHDVVTCHLYGGVGSGSVRGRPPSSFVESSTLPVATVVDSSDASVHDAVVPNGEGDGYDVISH